MAGKQPLIETSKVFGAAYLFRLLSFFSAIPARQVTIDAPKETKDVNGVESVVANQLDGKRRSNRGPSAFYLQRYNSRQALFSVKQLLILKLMVLGDAYLFQLLSFFSANPARNVTIDGPKETKEANGMESVVVDQLDGERRLIRGPSTFSLQR